MPFRAIYTSTTCSSLSLYIYIYMYFQARSKEDGALFGLLRWLYCRSCLYTVAIDETTSRHAIARSSFPFHSSPLQLLSLSFFPSLVQGSKVNLTTISRFSKIRAIFHSPPSLRVGTGSWNSSPLLIHQKSSLHERICQEEEPSSVSHLTSLIPPPSKKEKLRESNEVSLSMRNNCKGNFLENGTFTPEPLEPRGRIKEF